MKIIAPHTIAFTASVTEDELRYRMAMEVLEEIGALGPDGKPLSGVKYTVRRGAGRQGGYTITATGPMPARLALAKAEPEAVHG